MLSMIPLFYIEKPSMFMNDPDYVPSFNKDKRFRYESLMKRAKNKAAKGCSIEQATNNVPYTTESIEDNICLQKRMELLPE